AVSAQSPRPAPRDVIGPDDVRRVGDWLKGMQSGGPDIDPALLEKARGFLGKKPQLAKQLQDVQKKKPNPDAKQLQQCAEKLKGSPSFQNDQAQADFMKFAEKLGSLGQAPNQPNIGSLPRPDIGGWETGKGDGPGTDAQPGTTTKPLPNAPTTTK